MAITSRILTERGRRQAEMAFWEPNGYHNGADPWREERHWF